MSNAPRPDAEPTFTLFLLFAVLGLIGWAIWWLARVQILEVMRYIRLGELWFIGLFTDHLNACRNWLRVAPIGNGVPSVEVANLARACFGSATLDTGPTGQSFDYYNLSGRSMGIIGHATGSYMRMPIGIGFFVLAFYVIFKSPRNKFKIRHTLESFIKTQAQMWPVITPIVNFKPASLSARIPGSTVPDQIPSFAEALSPEEWIAWHRISVSNGIPDRAAVRRAFSLQLGPRWQGIDGQPPYLRALYAAFALKGAQKREESDTLLGKLSTCWTINTGFNMTPEITAEVERIVRDPALGGEVTTRADKHAYRTTAMLAALKWSRSMGGVLASAQFLWLRAVDRGIWYPFNSLGRRSFHVEGSGAMAHFMAEENAKKPLLIARVDTAIVALNQFLADSDKHPMPIPAREEVNAKTR